MSSATNSGPYPSPNISVGPPLHPGPHLFPYLYPHGLYTPPHMGILHNTAAALNPGRLNPGLLFNAQLALAAHHPALFGHYSNHNPSPLQTLKNNRFSPYNLPGSFGSAFEAVIPGSKTKQSTNLPSDESVSENSKTSRDSSKQENLSSSPKLIQRSCSISPASVQTQITQMDTACEIKHIEKIVNGIDVKNSTDSADILRGLKSIDQQETDQ